MIFKIVGGLLIAWAVADFGLSYMGTDVWLDWLGVELPEIIYRYSAMIVGVVGGVIFSLGGSAEPEDAPEA